MLSHDFFLMYYLKRVSFFLSSKALFCPCFACLRGCISFATFLFPVPLFTINISLLKNGERRASLTPIYYFYEILD